jgi:hypothetical protein
MKHITIFLLAITASAIPLADKEALKAYHAAEQKAHAGERVEWRYTPKTPTAKTNEPDNRTMAQKFVNAFGYATPAQTPSKTHT